MDAQRVKVKKLPSKNKKLRDICHYFKVQKSKFLIGSVQDVFAVYGFGQTGLNIRLNGSIGSV